MARSLKTFQKVRTIFLELWFLQIGENWDQGVVDRVIFPVPSAGEGGPSGPDDVDLHSTAFENK